MVKIDVRVPYEPDGKLGWDYNRIFQETVHEWVLVVDHDILLNTNPLWYNICQTCVDLNPVTAVFTCKTNAHHKTAQRDKGAPTDFDVVKHQEYAKQVWDNKKYSTELISPGANIAGFFMLINKKAWEKVEGFPGLGMFEEDWAFAQKIHAAGMQMRVMTGLYLMHAQKRVGTWDSSIKTSKEIFTEFLAAKKSK